jgi:hypothetical protein
MTRAARLLDLAQEVANERPTLFDSKGPGVGDKDTTSFVSELRRRAHEAFGADHAEQTICGASGLRVDYYFPEDTTIVEVAFLLKNSSEFEKDILKAIMAQENGQPVNQLVFIAKPGAVKRCGSPDRRSIIDWAARTHGLTIVVYEISQQRRIPCESAWKPPSRASLCRRRHP